MKFPLSWLKYHLETDASIDQIADAMTMAGLEIEHIENPLEKFADFSVCHVIEAVPHPVHWTAQHEHPQKECRSEAQGGTEQMPTVGKA